MTVKDLIELLQKQPQDARVLAYDSFDYRSSELVVSCGYTSNCYDEIYPIDGKDDAVQRVEKVVAECDELGIELLDEEKEVFYCIALSPYIPEDVKALAEKYDFENPDLLLQSYMSDVDFARASIISDEELDAYLREHLSPDLYFRIKDNEENEDGEQNE